MGAVSQTPPPAAGLAEDMKVNGKHIEELNEAFPSSRFNWSKFRWYHVLWLLWVPFGAVAVAVRFFLLGFYFVGGPFILPKDSDSLWFWTTWGTTCFYKTRMVKDDAHRGAYASDDFEYVTPHEVRARLERGAGGGRRRGARPADTLFALEHHAWFLDATLFHCLMYRNGLGSMTLVGRGAATDALVSLLLPREYAMMMGPGEKLSDMLDRWRAGKKAGNEVPFVLFPQGTTCAAGAVCEFQPRVVELLRDGEAVRPVAVDIVRPMPFINLRGLGASNLADLIAFTFCPWWFVVFTILPELPADLAARPKDAAKYMQEAVTSCGVRPKSLCAGVNLYDKRVWERRAMARQLPGYRATEFRLIATLQSIWPAALRWLPIALHYATLEPVLLLAGAAAALLPAATGGAGASLLFGPLGRAVALNLCVLHALKLVTRVPRPSWVFGRRLPLRPADLSRPVQSKDYALPSGHSAFVSCVWAAVATAAATGSAAAGAAAAKSGISAAAAPILGADGLRALVDQLAGASARAWGLPLWAHAAFGAFAAVAALARVYLALHWPSDVAGGLAVGAVVGAASVAWLDPLFLALAPATQAHLAAACVGVFALLCRFVIAAPTSVDRAAFDVWSEIAGTRVEPLDPKLWQVGAGIAAGVWGAAPTAAALAPAAAALRSAAESARAAAVAAGAARPLLIAASASAAVAGLAIIAAAAMLLLVLPARALAQAAACALAAGGKTAAKLPSSLETLRRWHVIVGVAGVLQAVLVASAVVAPAVEAVLLSRNVAAASGAISPHFLDWLNAATLSE